MAMVTLRFTSSKQLSLEAKKSAIIEPTSMLGKTAIKADVF